MHDALASGIWYGVAAVSNDGKALRTQGKAVVTGQLRVTPLELE